MDGKYGISFKGTYYYGLAYCKYYNDGVLSEATVDSLDVDIKAIIEKTCKEMKIVMCKPLYDI